MRERPREDGSANAAVQSDDEHQHPDERSNRWQRLDHIPEANSSQPEEHPRDRLPEYCWDERAGRDRCNRRSHSGRECSPPDDHRDSADAENGADREGGMYELAELKPALQHAVCDGVTQLAE